MNASKGSPETDLPSDFSGQHRPGGTCHVDQPTRAELPTLRGAGSLRRWLLVGTMAVVLGGGLVAGVANTVDIREQVEELFDAEMAQLARTLQSIFASYPDLAALQEPGSSPSVPLIYDDFEGQGIADGLLEGAVPAPLGTPVENPTEAPKGESLGEPVGDSGLDSEVDFVVDSVVDGLSDPVRDLFPDLLEHRDDPRSEYSAWGHRYEKKLAFQIWSGDGTLLIQTRSADASGLPLQPIGFRDLDLGGEIWRVFTLADHRRDLRIQVAQRDDVRSELTREIALHAMILPLLGMPLLAALLWFLINRGLQPLERLSRQVAGRAPFEAAPLPASGAPREVQPLITALNDLFSRVTEQARREQQFVADAAHELRTPLAAMKIHLQNAMRRSPDERTQLSLERSMAALERMIALAEQLLTLHRIDSATHGDGSATIDLQGALDEVLSEMQPVLQRKNVSPTVAIKAAVSVRCNPAHLHSLLLNLIANAVRHGHDHTVLEIEITGHVLRITDSGPGIPEGELQRVFERFYRVGGDQSPGTGLGLAIVSRIADHYGFAVRLRNRTDGLSGLVAEVVFDASEVGYGVQPDESRHIAPDTPGERQPGRRQGTDQTFQQG